MRFKIGEKISFLNETGEGVVKSYVNEEIVIVLDETGFDRKILEKELVKIYNENIIISDEDELLNDSFEVPNAGQTAPRGVNKLNGFWEIDVNRNIEKDSIYDSIDANLQVYIKEDKKVSYVFVENEVSRNSSIKTLQRSLLKNILYVGNNYISTEIIDKDNKNKRTMQIQTIDNLKNDNPINLEDLIDGGKDIFLEGAQSLLNIDKTILLDESNIGFVRKNGYWMLNGRVNYEKNEEELYKDFIIKAVPPEEMVGHDNHFILWDELKGKFPNMIDMYSSPNEDIIIIRNKFELLVYATDKENKLDTTPIATIEMPESDVIIMAEWATQKYTEIWRNEVLKRDSKSIEY